MGILCLGASSTLLCGEDRNNVLGLGCGNELVEVGSGHDGLDSVVGAVFPVDTDEAVRALLEKETDHKPQDGYAERLERGGLEYSWRRDAMDWICKVKPKTKKPSLVSNRSCILFLLSSRQNRFILGRWLHYLSLTLRDPALSACPTSCGLFPIRSLRDAIAMSLLFMWKFLFQVEN